MAIKVFFDTSVLPRNPVEPGAAFSTLVDLVESGELRVWVPELAVRERVSQVEEEVREAAAQVAAMKKGVAGTVEGVGECLSTVLKALEAKGERRATKSVDELLEQLSATVLPVIPENTEAVWQRYFGGEKPFAKRKSRADIPDAFIYEAALACREKCSGDTLHCVVADKRLRESLASLNSVAVHVSLKAFVESDAVKAGLQSLALWEEWQGLWQEAKAGVEGCREAYREKLDEAVFESVPGCTIGHAEEYGLLYVDEAVDEKGEYDLLWSDAEAIAPGWLSVPFSGELSITIDQGPHWEATPAGAAVHGLAEIKLSEESWKAGRWCEGTIEVEIDEVTV